MNPSSFEQYMADVDSWLQVLIGAGSDAVDWPYRDAYENGRSAKAVAREAAGVWTRNGGQVGA